MKINEQQTDINGLWVNFAWKLEISQWKSSGYSIASAEEQQGQNTNYFSCEAHIASKPGKKSVLL